MLSENWLSGDEWDAAAIDRRRDLLLEWARDRWAVDLGSVSDDAAEPDVDDDPDERASLLSDDGDEE